MADVSAAPVPVASPKKVAAKKPSKPKTVATHPPVAEMITAAIKALKARNGSSLPAIKKYIAGNYKADAGKLAPFIKKALKKGVDAGKLVRVKGVGAAGSFKLSAVAKAEKPKKVVAKKPAVKKSPTKAKSKKSAGSKKARSPKKAAKKPAAKKSPAKAKKPATKKAAKPAAKKATPKKAAKVKKPAAKKPAAKKPAARKTPTKK